MIIVKRFTAAWCAPCRMLKPVIEELEQEYPDVKFETIDVDANLNLAAEFEVRSVPTVLFLNQDLTTLRTVIGAHPKKFYAEILNELVQQENT